MIDFVKYEIKGINPEKLEVNPFLEFHNKVNTTTGELGNYLNTYFKGLEIKIFEKTEAHPHRRITLEGSLHKYWNKGAHNFNDFGINEIVEVVDDLKNKFGIYPQNCVLKQLEIGVNIQPPQKTKTILKNCLLHKAKRLKWVFTKDEGNYIQAELQRYILKIYDKQKHYKRRGFDIPNDIMRIELKFIKMHELNEKGIYSLSDLLYFGLHNFIPQLLKAWENVLFYDENLLKGTEHEQTFSNPNYWEKLTARKRIDQRKILNKFYKNNPQNLKNTIAILIQEKGDFLNSKIPVINPLHILLKTGNSALKREVIKKDNNRRFCIVTGLNISMQKENSFLLSITGLKYYFKTDKKVFEEVKRRFLTTYWKDVDHKTQLKEIYHNIRNKKRNQNNTQERLYTPLQPTLFELSQ